MKVLVTGGAGFIGSHVVDRLLASGHEVAVVDNLSTGRRENLAGVGGRAAVAVYECDIRSRDGLAETFAAARPEAVLHLAAQADVRVSVRDPLLDADVNVMGSLNVLERAREHGARRVVIASSGGTVYGEPTELPIDEGARGRPVSPYGISKRVLHDYGAFYESTHGIPTILLALANVYGPRQDPHGEAGVVAIFLSAMLEGRPTVIFGEGAQTRDYVYVSDVADAFERALGAGTGTYNIGTGIETDVNALWRACAEVAGAAGEPRHEAPRAGELRRSALDAGRASRELGWRPVTQLRDGLEETKRWIATALGRP